MSGLLPARLGLSRAGVDPPGPLIHDSAASEDMIESGSLVGFYEVSWVSDAEKPGIKHLPEAK